MGVACFSALATLSKGTCNFAQRLLLEEADLSMADLNEMSQPGAIPPQPNEVNKLKVTGKKSGSVKQGKQQSARDDVGEQSSR